MSCLLLSIASFALFLYFLKLKMRVFSKTTSVAVVGWFGLSSTCKAFVSGPLKLQNLSKIGIPSLFLKFVQTLRNFLDWTELFEQKNSYGWKDEWCCVAMQLLRHDEVAKGQLELPSARHDICQKFYTSTISEILKFTREKARKLRHFRLLIWNFDIF